MPQPQSTPPVVRFDCRAILFDLDGVLVDSADCIVRVWQAWAAPRGLDVAEVMRIAHGRRTAEAILIIAPDADAAVELAVLDAGEANETDGLREVPGATRLLRGLPHGSWAIVTSGRRRVAELRMRHVGLPVPAVLVVGEEVAQGKPHPEAYLEAASRLGIALRDCLVIEDAPAGIEAGRAAGMRVVAVSTTHRPADLSGADVVVGALADIDVEVRGGGLIVTIPTISTAGEATT